MGKDIYEKYEEARKIYIKAEEILKNYDTIVEKIVVKKVKIPYETIKKNVAELKQQIIQVL